MVTRRPDPRPRTRQRAPELQPYGTLVRMPIGLDESVCLESVEALNQTLVDTITLRDLYKKAHWQVAGHTFHQLHLLLDKHYEEQDELVDKLAERIQLLGGISLSSGLSLDQPGRALEIEGIPDIVQAVCHHRAGDGEGAGGALGMASGNRVVMAPTKIRVTLSGAKGA